MNLRKLSLPKLLIGAAFTAAAGAALINAPQDENEARIEAYENFWRAHDYAPLETAEGEQYRMALTERFAQSRADGKPYAEDLCVAHSLAVLQEKLGDHTPEVEESLFLTTQVMMLCAQDIRPNIN